MKLFFFPPETQFVECERFAEPLGLEAFQEGGGKKAATGKAEILSDFFISSEEAQFIYHHA